MFVYVVCVFDLFWLIRNFVSDNLLISFFSISFKSPRRMEKDLSELADVFSDIKIDDREKPSKGMIDDHSLHQNLILNSHVYFEDSNQALAYLITITNAMIRGQKQQNQLLVKIMRRFLSSPWADLSVTLL